MPPKHVGAWVVGGGSVCFDGVDDVLLTGNALDTLLTHLERVGFVSMPPFCIPGPPRPNCYALPSGETLRIRSEDYERRVKEMLR